LRGLFHLRGRCSGGRGTDRRSTGRRGEGRQLGSLLFPLDDGLSYISGALLHQLQLRHILLCGCEVCGLHEGGLQLRDAREQLRDRPLVLLELRDLRDLRLVVFVDRPRLSRGGLPGRQQGLLQSLAPPLALLVLRVHGIQLLCQTADQLLVLCELPPQRVPLRRCGRLAGLCHFKLLLGPLGTLLGRLQALRGLHGGCLQLISGRSRGGRGGRGLSERRKRRGNRKELLRGGRGRRRPRRCTCRCWRSCCRMDALFQGGAERPL